jgi:formylglycine-generating enzyme required for sulfatase activity
VNLEGRSQVKRWATMAILLLLVTSCAVATGILPGFRRIMPAAQRGREVQGPEGSTLVQVEGGEFIMGTDEKSVIFGKPEFICRVEPFWIGKYEVTNRQFSTFVEKSGYIPQGKWQTYFHDGLDDHPVVCVTWKDADAYCRWAGLRLPTEAEWEKAARGNEGRTYVWGYDWQPDFSNNWNLSRPDKLAGMADFLRKRGTTPVGSFPESVSVYGCWDMAGNVWEWTSTVFRPHPYRADDGREDPTSEEGRVMRGASWYSVEKRCLHCAERVAATPPGMFSHFIGFRVASTSEPRPGPGAETGPPPAATSRRGASPDHSSR